MKVSCRPDAADKLCRGTIKGNQTGVVKRIDLLIAFVDKNVGYSP